MATRFTEPQFARFNPEAGHWYDSAGRVVEAVPSADGKKMVRPDIRHARKLGLVPSVTAIVGQLKAAGLEVWKLQQLLEASLTLPTIANEPLEMRAARIISDYKEQADSAAQQGTRLHAAINRYYCEGLLPDFEVGCNAVHAIDEWRRGLGLTDVKGEVGFCLPELCYGGTADFTARLGADMVLVDFKSVDDKRLTKYRPYDENGYQLAGYAPGVGATRHDHWYNIAIGRGSGLIAVHQWSQEDIDTSIEAFGLLLRLWQIRNSWCSTPKEQA